MDIGYLYNIIDLYFRNEKEDSRTNLNIRKNEEEVVFSFNMNENDLDKTSFTLPFDDVKKEIANIVNIYKEDMVIIKEEYVDEDNPRYYAIFQNGRMLSFDGFSITEINNLRNILYNITINSDEIRLDEIEKEQKIAYNPNYRLQQAGFASYSTLFLVALYLTDVFLIALWVFKAILG